MASIDWKDAYYSVPVAEEFQIYLRFIWRNKLFQFTCLPNGISIGPRIFTKITKSIYSELRRKGHLNASYIDDSYLQGDSTADCRPDVTDTAQTGMDAGFVVHPRKSDFEPTQKLTYLGFTLDSVRMIVYMAPEKANRLKQLCIALVIKQTHSIRELAEVVGQMVASFPGVEDAKFHYRLLDNARTAALAKSKGKFDSIMTLSESARIDLHWWIQNIRSAYKTISQGNPQIALRSNASNMGWRGVCQNESSGGHWPEHESDYHHLQVIVPMA